MIALKRTRKSSPGAMAHMNDLLDEALKGTFPASDPIAINIELELPGDEIAITPPCFPRRSETHCAVDAVAATGGQDGA